MEWDQVRLVWADGGIGVDLVCFWPVMFSSTNMGGFPMIPDVFYLEKDRNCQHCLHCKIDPKAWKLIEEPDGTITKLGKLKCGEDLWLGRKIRYVPGKLSKASFLVEQAQNCAEWEPMDPIVTFDEMHGMGKPKAGPEKSKMKGGETNAKKRSPYQGGFIRRGRLRVRLVRSRPTGSSERDLH